MGRRKFEANGNGESQIVSIQTQENGICDNKLFFAIRLKELRSIAHLTQIDLAERLNLSKSAIANWESGRTRPDIANIAPLCKALGISIGEFFCDSPAMSGVSTEESRLLFNYRSLNAAHQRVLVGVSEKLLVAEEEMTAEKVIDLVQLPLAEDAVAAGFNVLDFSSHCEQTYIHSTPVARRADMIFHVNGDSMEPEYPNHCYVLVKRDSEPRYGEVGIFQVENSLFIKEFRKEGLYSLNPKWPLMRKSEIGPVNFIGRVIGILEDDAFATHKEIEAFKKHN